MLMILKVNIECQLSNIHPRHLEISTLNSSSRTAVKAASRLLVTVRCTQDLSAAPTVIRLLPQDVILPGCHPERSEGSSASTSRKSRTRRGTCLLPQMSPICCPGCHPERSEGSSAMGTQNL